MNTPRSGDPACAHGRSLLGPCVECEQLWKGSSVSTEQPISERSPTELEDQDRCEHGVAMAEACEQCAAEDDEWICAHIPEDVATQKLAGEQGERSYSPSDVESLRLQIARLEEEIAFNGGARLDRVGQLEEALRLLIHDSDHDGLFGVDCTKCENIRKARELLDKR